MDAAAWPRRWTPPCRRRVAAASPPGRINCDSMTAIPSAEATVDSATAGAPSGGRVFSGIQPSGVVHLGNYLGAIKNYIALQEGGDAIYCIVDYHALTSTHDSETIRRNTRELATDLLALGLDPEKAILFRQSDRPEHAELAYLLSTVVPVSWVERTPTFKEKKRDQPDDVNFALLTYPVLQAADIAIYHARRVPVGRDQDAHLELAREIVRAFNRRYGDYFPEPSAIYTESPVILGTDGASKMSKSLGNTIDVFADEPTLRKQVMSMVTDTQRILRTDPGRPEVCNVCQLHRFASPNDFEQIWDGERTARTGCVDTKRLLADRLLEMFGEARARRAELAARPGEVDEILRASAERLAPMAAETLGQVHERMGLAPVRR
ncbi:tryptophan--tRNA ligase [soil metagenome]